MEKEKLVEGAKKKRERYLYYLKQTEEGDTIAELMVSFLLRNGDGTVRNDKLSTMFLDLASKKNEVAKVRRLYLGNKDHNLCYKLLKELEEREENLCWEEKMIVYHMLGYLHDTGEAYKDVSKAIGYYEKSALLGNNYGYEKIFFHQIFLLYLFL